MARRSLVLIASYLILLAQAATAAPPDPAWVDALAAAKPGSVSGTVTAGGTYYHVLALGSADLGLGLYDGIPCLLGCELATGTPVTASGHVAGIDFAAARYPAP